MLICDYFGYLMTGERVIDHALAARTGVFDIEKKEFSAELLSALGIPAEWFSRPMRAGAVVGKIKPDWGVDATLVLGSHDQICAALGAGALTAGDAVDGMGTVECITALFEGRSGNIRMGRQGYPLVPYAVDGLYCTYMLNYSCGSAVRLVRKKMMHDYHGDEESFFAYMEKKMGDAPSGLLCLPYFGGASTPHQDLSARGAILGLATDTEDSAIYRAVLEGLAMEMRYNADTVKEYGIEILSAVCTGGGANSDAWLQIKADIQGIPCKTLRSSEGGLCGLAMLQAVAMGGAKDLFTARGIFVRYKDAFAPKNAERYAPYYEKYKKLYKTIKEI
jgi:xylulokinase